MILICAHQRETPRIAEKCITLQAGAQLMTWFGVACELHRDWRNDVEGLAALCFNHIPDYRNLMTSYNALTEGK